MIMKTLLSLLFLFVCAFAHAQYHNVEGIRVVGRSDSTTISNVGQIQFDADDDKFRFNDGTGWFSFLKEGSISASNGITKLGNDFQLGGALTKNTNINGSSFTHDLTFSALNTFQVTSDVAIILSRIASESTPAAGLAIGSAGVVRFIKGVAGNGQHYGFTTDSLMVITDDFKQIGLQYNGDYSANFTDSSLVDKRYVDGKVLEASGGWPLSGTASLTDDVEITSEDSLKLSPQVLMTPGQFSFVWDTTTVANNSSEVLTKDFFENFAEGMNSGYKVTAVIKITCIGVGFTQALGYYAGEKVYTVRRNYNGALTIIDSETIYQHNADEQPVDHILTVNGTGDSDDVLDLTISIGAVSNGMQFVTRVEVIYHAVYYEI